MPKTCFTLVGAAVALLFALSPSSSSSQSIRLSPPTADLKPTPPPKSGEKPAAPAAGTAASVNKPAPDFTLKDTEGKEVSLHDLRGKIVVLEWFNPDCPFVKHAHGKGPLKDLAKRVAGDELVWLTINSAALEKQGYGLDRNRAARGEYGIDNRVLLDDSGSVGKAYGAEKTPHIFIVDAKGKLVYRGGLDNAPLGVVDDERPRAQKAAPGTLEPYVENALDALRKRKKVKLAETPAYGCSVKYGG